MLPFDYYLCISFFVVAFRFIPNRSNLDLETSHHLLLNSENMDPVTGCMSPNSADLRRKMSEALNNGQVPSDAKILSFKQKAPAAKEGKNFKKNLD